MPTSRTGSDGYSLTELLVVLVIGVMLVAGASSLFFANAAPTRIREAAIDLATELRTLRSRAIGKQETIEIQWDDEAHLFSADAMETKIDDMIALSLEPAFANPGAAVNSLPSIAFYPDGSASGGVIHLALDGSEAALNISWLTGAVTVAR